MNKIKQASALQLTALIRKQQTGFSLVELAVVIVIIGLLATMGISALNVQQANGAITATKKNQETIKDALIGYLGKNKHLPCPATDELGGIDLAARNSGTSPPNCKTSFGLVPYAELGLPRSVALDGWDNFYNYAVSPQWTASLNTSGINVGSTTSNPANAFNAGNIGTIQVKTRLPANQNPPANLSTAVVALISSGINGFGAYTIKGTQRSAPTSADEASNAIAPSSLPLASLTLTNLFQREFTEKDAGYGAFDDVVLWISPNDLITPLIKDGSMKSPEAQWLQQVADIQNYLVPQLLNNALNSTPVCTANLILPPRYQIDPWGNSVSISSPQTFSASASSMYSLTISSPNPSSPKLDAPSSSSIFKNLNTSCP